MIDSDTRLIMAVLGLLLLEKIARPDTEDRHAVLFTEACGELSDRIEELDNPSPHRHPSH